MRKVPMSATVLALAMLVQPLFAQGRADARSVRRASDQFTTVAFHLTKTQPQDGYNAMTSGGQTLYVDPMPIFTSLSVTAATPVKASKGSGVELTLTPTAATQFTQIALMNTDAKIGIVSDGNLAAAVPMPGAATNNKVTINGLDNRLVGGLVSSLTGVATTPSAPTVMLRTSQTTVRPGQLITVEVYVAGTQNVRAFQAQVQASGASVSLQNAATAQGRADYVFGNLPSVSTANMAEKFLVGALYNGGVNAEQPSLVGTFTFQAPATPGTVNFSVDTAKTMLRNSESDVIQFQSGTPVTVTIAQ